MPALKRAVVAYNNRDQALLPVRLIQLGNVSKVARRHRGWWLSGRSVRSPTTAYPLTAGPQMRRLSVDGLWGAK